MKEEKMKIKTRMVLIIGPSSQGKTTLAKRLEKELSGKNVVISHDDVLSEIDKNQPQFFIDMDFRMLLLEKISEAVHDTHNKHIILDTVNIGKANLAAFIMLIKSYVSDKVTITLIKLNIPEGLNIEYGKKHYPELSNVEELILGQREDYQGEDGSLNTSFEGLVEFEYTIENPSKLIF